MDVGTRKEIGEGLVISNNEAMYICEYSFNTYCDIAYYTITMPQLLQSQIALKQRISVLP